MNLLPQEPLQKDLEDVAERAERGRAFYFMFPGSKESDRWLTDFEHVGTAAHGGNAPRPEDRDDRGDKRPL